MGGDPPVLQERDPVRDVAGEVDIVGHDQRGDGSFPLEAADHGLHDRGARRIQARGRLVVQEVAGLQDHGAGHGHLSLHPPRELLRHCVLVLAHADEVQVRMTLRSISFPEAALW